MLHSFHYFLFPFRFDYLHKCVKDRHEFYKMLTFDTRVYKKLDKLLENLSQNNWKYEPFTFRDKNYYNEFAYFHDFVKDSLFNLNAKTHTKSTSYYFRKNLDTLKLFLQVDKFNDFQKIYELDLVSITLRIFDTGIGVLAFETENRKYTDKKDILNINEYLRRIYPLFVGDNFSLDEVSKKFMSGHIEIKDKENKTLYKQDLKKDFQNIKELKKVKISPYILEILGKDIFTEDLKEKDKFLLQSVIDDRMFVMCWYGNSELADKVANEWYNEDCKDIKDFWYEFLFVDAAGKSIANNQMQEKLIQNATYLRWQELGTLYGISRYSFVNLTSSEETLTKLHANYLIENFKSVYYQMVVLVLAVRASILRFSDEITAISDLEPDERLYERVTNLYKNYLRFVNKLYFREITPQDQGIELYDMFQKLLKLERDEKDLDNEIKTLSEYVYMIQEKEGNEEMGKLTKIATYILPPSLVAGFFGMNVFGEKLSIEGFWSLIAIIGIMVLSVVAILWLIDKKWSKIFKRFIDEDKTAHSSYSL